MFCQPLAQAQNTDSTAKKIITEPEVLKLKLNEEVTISAKVQDKNGTELADTVIFFSRNRRSLQVTPDGHVKALAPGSFNIRARTLSGDASTVIPVEVAFPPIAEVQFLNSPEKLYQGTSLPLQVKLIDESGAERDNVEYTISSSNEGVAKADDFGKLKALKEGRFTLTLKAENAVTEWSSRVVKNPVTQIALTHNYVDKAIRTGDVIRFKAMPQTSKGTDVNDAPVNYSFIATPDDQLGNRAPAQIEQDGRFVANDPGIYTIMAKTGNVVAETTIRVDKRNVQRSLKVAGKGMVTHTRTSDLWVWEGVDGRDYALTGTWGGNGEAIFWDVTDPATITPVDTVIVDARTVNDVKVNEEGTVAVITREGASNRKNGIIILDVTNPSDVQIISEYTEGLTGGVHNTFIYEDHVYAVNNGRKYDIINIEDPANPYTVSKFELNTPGHSLHDVWIEDGIAYSSNWSDGVVAVDIGSKNSADMPGAGGSPENPVMLGSYSYPSGWNHAAFPFKSKSTGDFYILAGDEAFPYGLNVNGANRAAGWIHFVKFDDWDSPKEVARYQVPEAGTHNFWVKDDTLYVAYYNGGLRVVDISGELMGNLYDQGREIASFFPSDPNAFIPNATFTWGPQPHKGHIFISDWNSGIWALKFEELQNEAPN